MLKHFRVSWYEYTYRKRVRDLLITADTGTRAKAMATTILGKRYIQTMDVRDMKAEESPSYEGGRSK